MLIAALTLSLCGLPMVASANPMINEFMADNDSTRADEDGDFSDWIEIHNPTGASINLNGWRLTDEADNLNKWRFPVVTIPAGGYVLVFASGKDRATAGSELHADFKLSASGEYLALVDPDGLTIVQEFAPEYPAQSEDISYGLGLTAELRYFTAPTPGTANSTGVLGMMDEVQCSSQRGFYDTPFTLTLTSQVPDAQIRYTTDGTMPTSSHGSIYSSPLAITTTTVVRAAAFKSGYIDTEAVAHSFIFLDDVLDQTDDQNSRGFPDTWYAGASANYSYDRRSRPADYEMDPDIVSSAIYGPLMIDALTSIPTVSLAFDPNDLWNSSSGMYPNSIMRASANPMWEKPASMELIDPDGVEEGFCINAGARISGELARWPAVNDKQSFRVVFRGEYGPGMLKYDFFGDPDVD